MLKVLVNLPTDPLLNKYDVTTVSGVSSIDIDIVEGKYMPVSGVSSIENYPLTEGAYIL